MLCTLSEDQLGHATKLVDGATVPRDWTLLSALPSGALQADMRDGWDSCVCSVDGKAFSECTLMQFGGGQNGDVEPPMTCTALF